MSFELKGQRSLKKGILAKKLEHRTFSTDLWSAKGRILI